jgi:hypothetical protein
MSGPDFSSSHSAVDRMAGKSFEKIFLSYVDGPLASAFVMSDLAASVICPAF